MSKADLVLLTWNHLEYTKPAIESILKYTDVPSRLIIVDNGSDTPAKEYLQTVIPRGMVKEVLLLRSEQNEGYPRGMNRGLKESNAPYICILNNDILVTEGWLSEMIKVAEEEPEVGVINPSSNTIGQFLPKGETIESYAKSLKLFSGKWVEMGWCVGFCMLINRRVIEKIGYLDEIFGMAYFEDQDYSRRAKAAGYKCVMAKGSYVWHAENVSLGENLGNKRDALFKRNADIFNRRWGKPRRIAYVIAHKSDYGRIQKETLKFAKEDNLVTIFKKKGLNGVIIPEHSNITVVELPDRLFYITTIWRIAKKKKRFDKVVWI